MLHFVIWCGGKCNLLPGSFWRLWLDKLRYSFFYPVDLTMWNLVGDIFFTAAICVVNCIIKNLGHLVLTKHTLTCKKAPTYTLDIIASSLISPSFDELMSASCWCGAPVAGPRAAEARADDRLGQRHSPYIFLFDWKDKLKIALSS